MVLRWIVSSVFEKIKITKSKQCLLFFLKIGKKEKKSEKRGRKRWIDESSAFINKNAQHKRPRHHIEKEKWGMKIVNLHCW